jgi:hypothetical protein
MVNELVDCAKQLTPLVTQTEITITCRVGEVGGVDPVAIIQTDQAWYVDVEWEITGQLVHHFCGTWYLSVGLESIGPGPEYRFPTPDDAQIPMDPCGDGKYKHRINVNAGEVEARGPTGTVYQVSVQLGSEDACGNPGHISAHCVGEELQFVPGPVH